jgi:hypothetical protein
VESNSVSQAGQGRNNDNQERGRPDSGVLSTHKVAAHVYHAALTLSALPEQPSSTTLLIA